MIFWNYYLSAWYWFYLLLVPIVIFSARANSSRLLKNGRLLGLLFILPLLILPLDYARDRVTGTTISSGSDCWLRGGLFFLLGMTISAIYVGWWELGWRLYYRQISRNIRLNFQFGVVSSVLVIFSLMLTFWHILILVGCSICGAVEASFIFELKKLYHLYSVSLGF